MKVTEKAETKIEQCLKQENADFFRVKVQSGGCNGFSYEFLVDETNLKDDVAHKLSYGNLVIDSLSITFLKNSTLDYVDEIGQSGFKIINPNVKNMCGCGISFDF